LEKLPKVNQTSLSNSYIYTVCGTWSQKIQSIFFCSPKRHGISV